MFVHQHHLQYLLQPAHYFAERHLQQELQQLFRPAWHFVGTRSELSRSGDFLTLDLFGNPVLVRNCDGSYVAVQNVCAHRHCLLSSEARGRSPVLRCQYHGWEYDSTGKTAKIPDARCFRPWDRENSQLLTYRVEACGDLLFVALSAQLPSLADWLSPCFEELEREFSPPEWKRCWVWEYEAPCNWKVPVENTLESYHVASLHQKFYGKFYPSEEKSVHTLTPRYTELNYLSDTRMEAWQARLRSWLGGAATNRYVHRHFHPNTVFVTSDSFNYALMYLPLSPTSVRIRLRAYSLQGTRRDPISQLAVWYARRKGIKHTLQVHNEDRQIYPAQQRGIEVSNQRGVLGTREERIYAFQKYVLDTLGLPLPQCPTLASEKSV